MEHSNLSAYHLWQADFDFFCIGATKEINLGTGKLSFYYRDHPLSGMDLANMTGSSRHIADIGDLFIYVSDMAQQFEKKRGPPYIWPKFLPIV